LTSDGLNRQTGNKNIAAELPTTHEFIVEVSSLLLFP
jgi:hypothetical protein